LLISPARLSTASATGRHETTLGDIAGLLHQGLPQIWPPVLCIVAQGAARETRRHLLLAVWRHERRTLVIPTHLPLRAALLRKIRPRSSCHFPARARENAGSLCFDSRYQLSSVHCRVRTRARACWLRRTNAALTSVAKPCPARHSGEAPDAERSLKILLSLFGVNSASSGKNRLRLLAPSTVALSAHEANFAEADGLSDVTFSISAHTKWTFFGGIPKLQRSSTAFFPLSGTPAAKLTIENFAMRFGQYASSSILSSWETNNLGRPRSRGSMLSSIAEPQYFHFAFFKAFKGNLILQVFFELHEHCSSGLPSELARRGLQSPACKCLARVREVPHLLLKCKSAGLVRPLPRRVCVQACSAWYAKISYSLVRLHDLSLPERVKRLRQFPKGRLRILHPSCSPGA